MFTSQLFSGSARIVVLFILTIKRAVCVLVRSAKVLSSIMIFKEAYVLSRRKRNDSGMVMIMVLMVTIIIMVYSIGILSRGATQVLSAEDQVDRIKADQLTMGAYAKTYTDMAAGSAMPTTFTETLDGKAYTVAVTNGGATGPNNTNTLTITTTFSN